LILSDVSPASAPRGIRRFHWSIVSRTNIHLQVYTYLAACAWQSCPYSLSNCYQATSPTWSSNVHLSCALRWQVVIHSVPSGGEARFQYGASRTTLQLFNTTTKSGFSASQVNRMFLPNAGASDCTYQMERRREWNQMEVDIKGYRTRHRRQLSNPVLGPPDTCVVRNEYIQE
jgi:hypothetical protein